VRWSNLAERLSDQVKFFSDGAERNFVGAQNSTGRGEPAQKPRRANVCASGSYDRRYEQSSQKELAPSINKKQKQL
jgi:hypothetical protein